MRDYRTAGVTPVRGTGASRPVYLNPVRGLGDVMAMRRIRNEVRGFLTRDTSEIGWFRQAWWWWREYRPHAFGTITAYLVRPARGAPPIGYGIVRLAPSVLRVPIAGLEAGERWWVTGALVEGTRGYGYGRALFTELTAIAAARGGAAFLEVRADNEPAYRLYESLGYTPIGLTFTGRPYAAGEKVIVMAYLPA